MRKLVLLIVAVLCLAALINPDIRAALVDFWEWLGDLRNRV